MRHGYVRDLQGRFRPPRVEDEFVVMPESSRSSTAPRDNNVSNNISGPDFFGLYKAEIDDVLSQDVGLPTKKTFQTKESISTGFAPLYSDGIGARLSDVKRERLLSLLRQSIPTLTQEVDEMETPVLSVCRIRSCLKCKERLLSLDSSKQPQKKTKLDPACSKQDLGSLQLDDDLRFILENDSTKVEELLKRYTDQISSTLDHMEKSLEGILNAVMTSCRTMNIPEKQQLGRLLRKLPARNVDRVVEIVGHKNPSVDNSCDVLNIDLEKLDNVTLWRLYFYVAMVEAAKPT